MTKREQIETGTDKRYAAGFADATLTSQVHQRLSGEPGRRIARQDVRVSVHVLINLNEYKDVTL